jgi:hypothetical protein
MSRSLSHMVYDHVPNECRLPNLADHVGTRRGELRVIDGTALAEEKADRFARALPPATPILPRARPEPVTPTDAPISTTQLAFTGNALPWRESGGLSAEQA